jgi:hypothetical protein
MAACAHPQHLRDVDGGEQRDDRTEQEQARAAPAGREPPDTYLAGTLKNP